MDGHKENGVFHPHSNSPGIHSDSIDDSTSSAPGSVKTGKKLVSNEYEKLGSTPLISGKQFILPDGTITKSTHFHRFQLEQNGLGTVQENLDKGLVRTISDDYNNFNIEVHHKLTPAQLSIIKQHLRENDIRDYHFEVDDRTRDEVVNKQLEGVIPHFQARTLPQDMRNDVN